MSHLRIVGDVHGKFDKYIETVKDCDYSLQVGDMGFNYKPLHVLDSRRHKFYGGNHDNYDKYDKCQHALGHYGEIKFAGFSLFYIRGAYSIDKVGRQQHFRQTGRICWWKAEELSMRSGYKALDLYKKTKPSTMLTHDCPKRVGDIIGDPKTLRFFGHDPDKFTTRTQELLDSCFDEWKPDVWIFGHWHKHVSMIVDGTLFICLPELYSMDIAKDGTFTHRSVNGRIKTLKDTK